MTMEEARASFPGLKGKIFLDAACVFCRRALRTPMGCGDWQTIRE